MQAFGEQRFGTLEAVQEGADLGVGPVLGADEFAPDDALAIDDVGLRPHLGVKEPGGRFGGVAHGDEVDVAAGEELAVGIRVFVDADAEDGQIGVFVVQIEQGGQLLDAGRAPGGPEVDQDDFASIVGQMDAGGAVGDGEVGRYLAGLRGVRTAVAGCEQGQRQKEQGSAEATGEHVTIIRAKGRMRKGRARGLETMGSDREGGAGTPGGFKQGGFKPVLGLSSDPGEPLALPVRYGTVYDQPEPEELIELTVIVPARNEEDCLGACLHSLINQSEEIFELGRDWELVVVDDGSTDGTAQVARGFAGVTVIEAGKLEHSWTGKANAIWTAAKKARGRWLLFTDADTVHELGGLRRAIHEAERHKVGVLSYSPRQLVSGLAQRSLMPLVFCELALAYPPAKVSDPGQRIAAANGQFLLVEREAYRRLGGHASVADKVLEDVELAFLAKRRKVGLRFRYAEDAVSTRMYRTTRGMVEGWTKNLALLFDNSLALAAWRALDIVLLIGLPVLTVELWDARFGAHSLEWLGVGWVLALLWVRTLFRFYARVAKSNFPFLDCALTPLGLPLFVILLYRSWFQHRILKRVSWKGREYAG